MNIERIHLVFFSPVFHTRAIVRILGTKAAEELHLPEAPIEHDVTDSAQADLSLSFGPQDLVILAAPVYGGRIPTPAAQRLLQCQGRKTPAVLVVSYGNRAFEDSLLELKDIAEKQDFLPVAAAACVAEHTIAPVYAAGRPDADDEKALAAFAASVKTLLNEMDPARSSSLSIPGNTPYRVFKASPLATTVNDSCVRCGLCAQKCPTHAIAEDNPATVHPDLCISCMRCVNTCPRHARRPSEAMIQAVTEKLAPVCSGRKDYTFFPG